ncbi:MAG: S8 family serine peptidase [Oscillospiraceae bacterium]|nr:S8 family serine peptidase [Oscillospiraceae bacterium]
MSRTTKRFLSILLAAAMILSLGITGWAIDDDIAVNPDVIAAAEEQTSGRAVSGTELELEEIDPSTLNVPKLGEIEKDDEIVLDAEDLFDLDEVVRVSIVLDRPATLSAGYSTENIAANRAAMSYRQTLRQQQAGVEAAIASAGVSMNVKWNLTLAVNIISAEVRVGDIETIKEIPGVADVWLETRYEPQFDEVNTAITTEHMVGATAVWKNGYTGAGSRVAIIDTGTDQDHQSFDPEALEYALEKDGLTPDLLTWDDISAVASELNVQVTEQVYKNTKIPYAYNYVDGGYVTDHLSDTQEEHGSHVSGIAAANRYVKIDGEFVDAAENVFAVGVAPDAQILTMKVFGAGGGAYDSDYMTAIEDAIILNADSVNLSLGSGSPGFTFSNGYQDIMDSLVDSGTVVVMSAGNSYNWAEFLPSGIPYLYLEDVSLHTGGSPGSFANSLGVASADNIGAIAAPLVFNGDMKTAFNESSGYNNSPIATIAGTYDYVLIDGPGVDDNGHVGQEGDAFFALGSDVVRGKIALCYRGTSSFFAKANAAVAQGAAAVIIINNTDGTIAMNLSGYEYTAPVVSILKVDGDAVKAASEKITDDNGNVYYTGKVEVTSEAQPIIYSAREDATISTFSSWGVPGSLILKPEITAPGGSIYSVFGSNKHSDGSIAGGSDQYEYMSGTSMAAPHVTGMAALLGEYVRENDLETVTGLNARTLINSLLMSTSSPMIVDGAYLPVLQQGSGLGDTYAATQAKSYIMMGEDATASWADGKVKVELGQDAAREGVYSYSFSVNNFSDTDMTYELGTDIFTQWITSDGVSLYMDKGTQYLGGMYEESYAFEHKTPNPHDVNKDGVTDKADAQAILDYLTGKVDGETLDLAAGEMDGTEGLSSYDAQLLLTWEAETGANDLVVPAGESVPVTVTITFSDDLKGILDNYFTNGAWIEGFTYVTPKTTSADGEILGVEHSIPVLGFYGSFTEASMFDCVDPISTAYGNTKTSYTGNDVTNYLTVNYGKGDSIFMGNPYIVEEEFPADRLALSSDTQLVNFKYNLIRNAGTTGWLALDAAGDLIKNGTMTGNTFGAWYYVNGSQWRDTGTKTAVIGTTADKLGVKEGESFTIGEFAVPEYYGILLHPGENVNTVTPDEIIALSDSGELGKGAFLGYTFTVDNEAPTISSVVLSEDKTSITVTAKDDNYIAYVAIVDLNGNSIVGEAPAQTAPGEEVTVTLDSTGLEGAVAAFVADYAANENASLVRISGEGPVPVDVTTTIEYYKPTDSLVAGKDYLIVSAQTAGTVRALTATNSGYLVSATGTAVTVENGTIGTYTGLYIDVENVPDTLRWTTAWDQYNFGQTFQSVANGSYLYMQQNNRPACYSSATPWNYENNQLTCNGYYVDGSGNELNITFTWNGRQFYCSTSAVTTSIYLFERVEDQITETIEIDPDNASAVTVYPEELILPVGETGQLKATVEPLVLPDKSVTWSSEDESIATVDENGVVTAVASGETKIIATSNATPTVSGSAVVKVPAGMDATVYAQVAFNDDVQFAAIDLNDMSTENLSGTNVFSYFTGGAQSGGFIYGNDTDNDFHSYNGTTYEYDSFWHDIYEVIQAPFSLLDGASIPNFTYVVTDAEGVETEVPFNVNLVGVCPAGYLAFYDEGGLDTLTGFNLSSYGPLAIAFAGIGTNDETADQPGSLYMNYYVLDKTGALRVFYLDILVTDGEIDYSLSGGNLGTIEGFTVGEDTTAYSMVYTGGITGAEGVLIADNTNGSIYYVAIDYSASPYLAPAELVGVVKDATNLSTLYDNAFDAAGDIGTFPLDLSGSGSSAIDAYRADPAIRSIPLSVENLPLETIGYSTDAVIDEPVNDDIVIGGEDDEIIVVGGLDAVRSLQPRGNVELLKAGELVNPTYEEDGYVEIAITTPDATDEVSTFTNGFATLAYDPAALSFQSLTPNAALEISSFTVDEEAGLIKFAYASTEPVEAGAVANVKFSAPAEDTVVTVTTVEANDNLDVNEVTEIPLEAPEGFKITIEDFTKEKATVDGIDAESLYLGEVSFKIASENDQAVLVAVKEVAEDGSESYTRLICSTDEASGEHSFTITVDQDVTIALAFKGDVNLDGEVKASDATMIKRMVAGTYEFTKALSELTADVNGDGSVKSSEATMISRSITGSYVIKW